MRRNLTISFDAAWIELLDQKRRKRSRGEFLEALTLGIGWEPDPPMIVDERSLDPQREAQAAAERQMGKSPEDSIAAVRQAQSAKPPLQRPIIQKRGT